MNLKKLAKGMLCLYFALFSTMSYAQNKEVTGKVTDSKDGSPVAGISVLGVTSSGKKVGTATANDGTFKLSSVEGISKIILSGVGFDKQDLNVSGKSEVAVSMKGSNNSLNEVTVVGYGTLKKREITSAITRVNAEQFNKGNINDVAQLLQGKVA
ncbi:carboxypeptidase-like regulatory domain-containing protein, partial [Ferruginibacter sp.]|uniref:carboxypeptidase-like regulatory domain-containing protein n=1 Tax=Ferruginibacter sp. TaxID=1940288 RepID=UPI0019B7C3E3